MGSSRNPLIRELIDWIIICSSNLDPRSVSAVFVRCFPWSYCTWCTLSRLSTSYSAISTRNWDRATRTLGCQNASRGWRNWIRHLHRWCTRYPAKAPRANGTLTHDLSRGEEVRASTRGIVHDPRIWTIPRSGGGGLVLCCELPKAPCSCLSRIVAIFPSSNGISHGGSMSPPSTSPAEFFGVRLLWDVRVQEFPSW